MNEKPAKAPVQSIGATVRRMENDYINGQTVIGKYVTFSQYENLEKIDAYLNSKHTSGPTDSLNREKPFFNIVTGAVNIWYRATDIDRKDIRIKATKGKDFIGAFLASIHLQEWMKREAFGMFLNEWGRSLARYGSSPLKFVEQKGRLIPSVIPWNRLISDTVDFENNPKIEKLYLTPSQLRTNKNYNQQKVEELISAKEARETIGKEKKDSISEYLELYEVHGIFPLSLVTDKPADDDKWVQQMHVVSFVAKEQPDKDGKTEYSEFTMLKGREKQDPYMLTHLIKEDGRAQSIGAVEHLFDAQWMRNHTAKNIKDQLDFASKLIMQTSDGSFIGQNVLTNIETGDILIHKINEPLTELNNQSHDITSLQNFGNEWSMLAKEITSTPDSISGGTMPSGTAYRQVAILNQESHSLFELMTENKGLHIEEMFRKFVIPFLKKQMTTSEEIAATLEAHDVTQLDTLYINAEVIRRKNQHIKDHMLKQNGQGGEVAPPFDSAAVAGELQANLATQGNQRFIKPSEITTVMWSDILKDLEWVVEVEVTNEQTDKEQVLTTLNTVLTTIAGNPLILQDPNARMIFNKILETTGALSPLELKAAPAPNNAPAQPVPKESINYKDLPPELKPAMEAQAGLKRQGTPK